MLASVAAPSTLILIVALKSPRSSRYTPPRQIRTTLPLRHRNLLHQGVATTG